MSGYRCGVSKFFAQTVFRLGAVLLVLVCLCSGCRQEEVAEVKDEGQGVLMMPDTGAYTGAYVDFGEGEDDVTFDAIAAFEQMTGKHLAIVAFGNFWGEQAFPAQTMDIVAGYGAIPLIFWSPWDRPYMERQGPDRFSLTDILAGKWDAYIDQWADAARAYGKPILVSWGLEMNGSWFPWSGVLYGGGRISGEKDGKPLYAGPELFKQAYRHVVDRVRARRAVNILWGFHANNANIPDEPWNRMASYYPGPDYVDWLGLSAYGKLFRGMGWATFDRAMDGAYGEICRLDPQKPVILAEWGVGEFPPGDKAGFISQVFADLPVKYQRVKAAVFWHERWENEDGSFSNLRVNSSPESLDAYRAGVADPYWLDRPRFHLRPESGPHP